MPNPTALIFDTDVLIQVFLTQQTGILRTLRSDFRVQPLVVDVVESEARYNANFRGRFEPAMEKAIKSGLISVFDYQNPGACVPSGYFPTPSAAQAAGAQILVKGRQLIGPVHGGEAYSYAVAMILGLPLMSNDKRAITALLNVGEALPSPVLRFMDLMVFGFQAGAVKGTVCNSVRQQLRAEKEHLPAAFFANSFEDGLANFQPRLLLSGAARVGRPTSPGSPTYRTPLVLAR